jgi:CheY-like chemotaxis protein
MRHVLVLSPHPPSRQLFVRVLAEPDVVAHAAADGDEAFAAIARCRPAVVVVDLRRPDDEHPLFLGLLRRRHPHLPVISLLPGCLRVADGSEDRVEHVPGACADELRALLEALQEAVREVLARRMLRLLRPPVGRA